MKISEQPQKALSITPHKLPQATLSSRERFQALMLKLPEDYAPYTDKYFLRSLEILKSEGLNPWVRAQVFIRKGPGVVGGVEEALTIIHRYSDFIKHGGRVYGLKDGDTYKAGESVLMLEGPIQDIIALETMYLGVLSYGTTIASEGPTKVDLSKAEARMREVVTAAEGRPVIYFGARHWHYKEDKAISWAAYQGGAKASSTDVGEECFGKKGKGTIPHVLENIYAWKYGKDQAVVEATKAFDRVIAKEIERIALIDYRNHEIDDSLATALSLKGSLYGIRVDTCGENIAQGALVSPKSLEAQEWVRKGVILIAEEDPHACYWYGNGVTVTGVYALRKALDEAGFFNVKITLSSGFGDPEKVKAFVRAEKILGVKLFDTLGVGGIYDSRSAKTDIVAVGEDQDKLKPISKAGREYRPNSRFSLLLLGD